MANETLRRESPLAIQLFSEGLGTALLLAGVVGSGIMAENLAGGNAAVALLANAVATGALLPVLIAIFAPVSGAHFNPLVSALAALQGRVAWPRALAFVAAQGCGAWLGVLLAHAMFGLPLLQASDHMRSGLAQILSEIVATTGLLLLILRLAPREPSRLPVLVGLYITAAYWFTASTSFANPAVTLARAFTKTFAGIRLQDAPGFWLGQIAGLTMALLISRMLGPVLPFASSSSKAESEA